MPTKDTTEIKNKIIEFLKNNGPSLPVQISRSVDMDTLFTSAFLSELLSEKKIKITNMKVGTSPVYFVSGTEEGLEKYSEYLNQKEKEAFNLLKENSFLDDEPQEPAIRVALRQIKDFAMPFEEKSKLFWRYFLARKEDFKIEEKIEKQKNDESRISPSFVESVQKSMLEQKEEEEKNAKNISENEAKKEKNENEIKIQELRETNDKKELERIIPTEEKLNFQNPFVKKEEPKKKEKPKSAFVKETISYLEKEGIKLVKEISHKSKELNCLVKINSDLGPIIFYTLAKDKKTITESDLTKLLGESQTIPLPALIISKGDTNKKSKEFLEKFASVLKFKKIE